METSKVGSRRKQRDLADLLSHDPDDGSCTSANIVFRSLLRLEECGGCHRISGFSQESPSSSSSSSSSSSTFGVVEFDICIFEGPYRGGSFRFVLDIPPNYPFSPPEMYSVASLCHPNIHPLSGKVSLPMEWSPVLTLKSAAYAVQFVLLEPCINNIVNMEAHFSCANDPVGFEHCIQEGLHDQAEYLLTHQVRRLKCSLCHRDTCLGLLFPPLTTSMPCSISDPQVAHVMEVEGGSQGSQEQEQGQGQGQYEVGGYDLSPSNPNHDQYKAKNKRVLHDVTDRYCHVEIQTGIGSPSRAFADLDMEREQRRLETSSDGGDSGEFPLKRMRPMSYK